MKYNAYQAFQYKEFRWFFAVRLLVTMAFSMQFLVIEWKIYQLTHNVFHLGLIPLAEIISVVLFSLFSGHWVDKNKKRKSLLISLLSAIFIGLLFSYVLGNSFTATHSPHFILQIVLLLVFCWGIVRAFYTPSAFSLYSLIIPKSVYANAATWNASAWQLGFISGPILGGFFYAMFQSQITLHIAVALLFLAVLCVLQIQEKPLQQLPKEKIIQSLSKGFLFIFNNKIIFSALILDLIAVFFGGAVALLPAFIKDVIDYNSYANFVLKTADFFHYKINHTNKTIMTEQIQSFGLGLLRAAMGIGALISMITISFFPVNKKSGKKLMLFIGLFGLSIIAFGLSTHFIISFVCLIFAGLFDGVSVVIRSTILQLLTPDDMRGRVSSVNSIFVGSSNEFGAFESGTTAKIFGTVRAVILGGSITVIVVLASYFKMKKLRDFQIKDFGK